MLKDRMKGKNRSCMTRYVRRKRNMIKINHILLCKCSPTFFLVKKAQLIDWTRLSLGRWGKERRKKRDRVKRKKIFQLITVVTGTRETIYLHVHRKNILQAYYH
jgi:hypothetical protein